MKIFDGRPGLSHTQKKLQKQEYSIPNSRAGVGYKSSELIQILGKGKIKVADTYHITIEESKDSEEGKKVKVKGVMFFTASLLLCKSFIVPDIEYTNSGR